MNIGVFDSGVGGLSVLKSLIQEFPESSFVYLGDTARLPYGTKSKKTILSYVERNLHFLNKNFSLDAIVIACNSASSVLNDINSSIPVIGVIEAGVRAALKATKKRNIGLWATRTTVEIGRYESLLDDLDPQKKLHSVACPLLVTLVEEGLENEELALPLFQYYYNPLKKHDIDTLIMGCTHFPFLQENLEAFLKKNCEQTITIVDASSEISNVIHSKLSMDTEKLTSSTQEIKILLTDGAKNFKNFALTHLPKNLNFDFSMVEI